MRATGIALVVLIVLSVSARPATSPQPYLQMFLNSQLTGSWDDCPDRPPGMIIDSLYVVARDFNTFISANEFRAVYPLFSSQRGLYLSHAGAGRGSLMRRPQVLGPARGKGVSCLSRPALPPAG